MCGEQLTHWGQVTHIYVSKLTIIGSDNGLSPGRRQAIIWTNAGMLLIWPSGRNFSEILIEIYTFSFKKMHWKMSSGKWQPFCLGLHVLSTRDLYISSHSRYVMTECVMLFWIRFLENQRSTKRNPYNMWWCSPGIDRSASATSGHMSITSNASYYRQCQKFANNVKSSWQLNHQYATYVFQKLSHTSGTGIIL